jgi:hypothetical protein
MVGQPAAEITRHMASPDWDLSKIIESQLVRLEQQLTELGTLRNRLAEVASVDAAGDPGLLARTTHAGHPLRCTGCAER